MNKKLLAVAVAGAIGAPGLAFAQAANVNIYGHLDGRYDSMKFTGNSLGTITGMTKQHVQFQAPRWGLRGSESLGGGLTAFFQLESGISVDGRQLLSTDTGGVNTFGGRDSWLGLRSSWGELKAGGFGTAYGGIKGVWGAQPSMGHGGIIMGNGDSTGAMPSPNCVGHLSPAGIHTGGTAATPTCQPQAEANGTAFNRRQSNYIEYSTPNFSGFSGKIGTAASEWAEPSSATPAGLGASKPKLWSYSLIWSGGPWSAGLGYEQHTGFRATNGAGTQRMAKDTGWTVGGKWTFGAGQIGVGWERLKYGNQAAVGAENNFQLSAWVINGSWKITPAGTLSAGYSKNSGAKSCGAGLTEALGTCGNPTQAKHVSLGYDHALSKRTALYAIYSKITNNGNTVGGATYYYIAGPTSNNSLGSSGGLSAGTDVSLMGVGVKHNF